jgi:hypothetical protein
VNATGWSRGLEVSGGGAGVVSHAGLVLLRHLADKTGLTSGLSRALASPRILHAAARLVRGRRKRRLKIQASWPWAEAIASAWQRIDTLPQAP